MLEALIGRLASICPGETPPPNIGVATAIFNCKVGKSWEVRRAGTGGHEGRAPRLISSLLEE
jgi:hypothetical protein